MEKFEVTSRHKYAHVFMVNDEFCDVCDFVETHSYAIVSTNKAFNNATRIKKCENCGTVSLAPIS